MNDDDIELDRTADPSDIATRQEELARRSALAASRKPEGPKPALECLFCGAGLDGIRRWCDAWCSTAWQNEQNAKARNGR